MRKYPRADYFAPLTFKSFSVGSDQVSYHEDFEAEANSKNIGPGGILFQTRHTPPRISSVLWMSLDRKAVEAVTLPLEIGKRPLIVDNGLLGKVVHVEENPDDRAYQVGISFVTKFDAALP